MKDSAKSLLIVFGDKTASEIIAVAKVHCATEFAEIRQVFYTDQTFESSDFNDMVADFDTVCYILGVVDPGLRAKIQAQSESAGFRPYSVIHPTAEIDGSATVGEGCYIAQFAVVSVNAIVGDHSIVHLHASIGHDAVLGAHCAILPGARICGEVTMGAGVLVGTNSAVHQQVNIGDLVQIDAMTYVFCDVPDKHLVSTRLKKPVRRLDV